MSIIKNNNEVVRVFKGTLPLSYIYKGERLVWQLGEEDDISFSSYEVLDASRFFEDKAKASGSQYRDVLDNLVNCMVTSSNNYLYTINEGKLSFYKSSDWRMKFSRKYGLYIQKNSSFIFSIIDNGSKIVGSISKSSLYAMPSYEFCHNGYWYVAVFSDNHLYKITELADGKLSIASETTLSNLSYIFNVVYHNGLLYYVNGNKVISYDIETKKSITYSGIFPSSVGNYLQIAKFNDRVCCIGYNDYNIYDFETREVIGNAGVKTKLGSNCYEINLDNLCLLDNAFLIFKDLEFKTITPNVDFVSYSFKYQIYAYSDTVGIHVCSIGSNQEVVLIEGNYKDVAICDDYILAYDGSNSSAFKLK